MYKIFINNRPLILAGNHVREAFRGNALFVHHDSDATFDLLFQLAQTEPVFFDNVFYLGESADELMGLLQSRCKLIEAAGGLVRNEEGKLLLIYRNEKWDLPKGKLEAGESPEEGAVREVEEECGISGLSITRLLEPTFHTYELKGKTILKKTWWYEMRCTDKRPLTPQTEEGITDVRWMTEAEVQEALKNTYNSIAEVLEQR